jgi:hypothetical protein
MTPPAMARRLVVKKFGEEPTPADQRLRKAWERIMVRPICSTTADRQRHPRCIQFSDKTYTVCTRSAEAHDLSNNRRRERVAPIRRPDSATP